MYFNLESFLQKLENEVEGKYEFYKKEVSGKLLRVKVTNTPFDFVYITFETNGETVQVALDFSYMSTKEFEEDMQGIVTKLSQEGEN